MGLERGQIVITVQLNTNAGRGIAFGGAEGLVVTRGTISKGRNLLSQLIPKHDDQIAGSLGCGRVAFGTCAGRSGAREECPGRLYESV